MAQLVVDTNSWVSVDDADDYMDSRYGSWEFWDDDTNKQAALITAYKQLNNSDLFTGFPTTATQNMKDAQCEMALFLVSQGGDIMRRQALQAQGVKQAGIVKESYALVDGKPGVSFPPDVMELLDVYKTEDGFYAGNVDRGRTETDVL